LWIFFISLLPGYIGFNYKIERLISKRIILKRQIRWLPAFLWSCIFLSLDGQSFAQNLETVFSRGYDTHVFDFCRLTHGRWVIGTLDSALPDSVYADTITLRIIDSTGLELNTVTFHPPQWEERFEINKIFSLPGDQFLVNYGGGACDVGGNAMYLEKFDSVGHSLWLIHLPEHFYPFAYGVGIDSNILLTAGGKVSKISNADGSVLWQTGFVTYFSTETIFVPGTEDIIVTDEDGLKYYKQIYLQGEVSYVLFKSELIPHHGSIGMLQTAGDGIFYAYKYLAKEVIRFRDDLIPHTILDSVEFYDIEAMTGGLATLKRNLFNSYQLVLYDTSGVLVTEYQSPESGLRPRELRCYPGGMGVTGNYGSGRNSTYNPDYLYIGRQQGWFRYFPQYEFVDMPLHASLAVTDIKQQEPIIYDSTYNPGYGGYYGYLDKFKGGNFAVQVTNTGTVPVYSFWVNTSFEFPYQPLICAPPTAQHMYVQNQELLAGESIWIKFGDINATSQSSLPDKFCFWTSGNNSKPDDQPQDDLFCIDRIVNTNEIPDHSFSAFPNPANSIINITYPTQSTSPILWNLVNVYGRIVKKIKTENNTGQLTIDVVDLPSGIYFINSENYSKTIIIQH